MLNDQEYYDKVKILALCSSCHGRKVGALLVDSYGVIIGRAWNDSLFPSLKCRDFCYKRFKGYKSGEGLEFCPAIHAETRCLAMAASFGKATKGGTLYLSSCIPCKNCLGLLILAEISEIVCNEYKFYDEESSRIVKANMNSLKIRTFNLEVGHE